MEIGYCKKCNIPVLGERCSLCGLPVQKIRFHDLGDIRPASKFELEKLRFLIPFRDVKNYLSRRVVLLSRQPGLDYRKDVFIDGFKFGTLEYVKDREWRWRFIPTGRGAMLIHILTGHEDFSLKSGGHWKGKKIDRHITGDWAIARIGKCIALAVNTGENVRIKDVYCRPVQTARRSSIKDMIEGNLTMIHKKERKGVEIIQKTGADYAAFSGGKDSEVSLYLAHLAGVKKAVFLNTGLEFPETERFVYNFADFLGVELIELRPKKDFWSLVNEKGIPTKENRWCTAYLKLNLLKNLRGVIVDGMRKYESLRRMHAPTTRRIGNLRTVYPIYNYLSLEVWLYIYYRQLPYNPLYDMGYERLGCYMCPSMLNAEFHNLKRTHPQLFQRWYRYLRKSGYSHEEIMDGKWRWNTLPPKLRKI